MATITYPASNLGAPKSARKRNDQAADYDRTIALVGGLGVMAVAGAAAYATKRPSVAILGLLLGVTTSAVMFERAADRASR
jgi:hypothetical protein